MKVIIDTDPGIDDSWALLLAIRSPEVQILGVTTLYGNVTTKMATKNALYILELFGRPDVPVVQGSETSLTGEPQNHIADFVHGDDGFGNTRRSNPRGTAVPGKTAAEFIVETVNAHDPGEVTVIALASATNVAMAMRLDPGMAKRGLRVVHLGGAFRVNGNVNPAAEANVFCDPEAADELYGSGADVTVIGLDVTERLFLTRADLDAMRTTNDESTNFLRDISEFYVQFHERAVEPSFSGMFMHDPAAVLLAFRPDLFTIERGAVRVECEKGALCRGQTVFDEGVKRWTFANAWTEEGRGRVGVAVDVDAKGVMDVFRARYEIGGGGKARTRMVVAGVLGVVRKVGSVLRGIVPRDILSNSKREK